MLLLGLLTTLWPAAPVGASWATTATGSAQATAPDLLPPGTLTATCAGGSKVRLDWVASASGFVTDYEVRYGVLENPPTSNLTSVVGALTFLTPSLGLLGVWNFSVRSVKGSWRSGISNVPSRTIAVFLVCL